MFSKLFGRRPRAPTRQGYTEADQQMLAESGRLQAGAQAYLPAQNTRIAEVADSTSERDAAARVGSVTAAQRFGRAPVQDTFDAQDVRGKDSLLSRVRAVSRVSAMGDEQAKMQGLRDRVSMLKYGRGLRSGAYSALAGTAGVQGANQSTASAAAQRPDYNAPYVSNFLGTIAGAGLGYYQNRRADSLQPYTPVHGGSNFLQYVVPTSTRRSPPPIVTPFNPMVGY